ncbi:MAG: DUF2079 domain-containing protein [Anaerolineae bacterium]
MSQANTPGHDKRQGPLWPQWLAIAFIALYICTFAWLALLRHASFDSEGFDLGVYDQVVWNTLHGRPFFYTSTGRPLLHLSNHASFILLLIAPFYLLYQGPQTLLVLQAVVVGLGGLPLFWLAREKLGSVFAGLSVLSAYLLFPPLQVALLSDFHPPVLAVCFLNYAFYFLEKRRAWLSFLFALLAMMCKEQMPLVVMMLGLYALFVRHAWRLGAALVITGATWFFMVMYVVIPTFSVTGSHIFLEYYAWLGNTPLEIVANALTQPDKVIAALGQSDRLAYLRDLVLPWAGLPMIGLPVLLIGLPAFGINLLSSNPAMYDATRGHYSADVAPWLAWGALFGMYYLVQAIRHIWPGGGRATTWGANGLLLAVALVWHTWHGYAPLALDAPYWEVDAHDRLAQRFLQQIPPDASIAAQGDLYPHVSERVTAYHLPDVNDAEYVWVDAAASSQTMHPNDLKRIVDNLLKSGEFGVQDAADGYLLLRRGLPQRELPDAFYDFARVRTPTPQYAVRVDFGDQVRLLGFDVLDNPRRGETSVRFYWQILRLVKHKMYLYPFFLNPRGEIVEDTRQRPMIAQLWYPPRRWRVGETVVATTLPWRLGERWSLGVGVLKGTLDWGDRGTRLKVDAVALPSGSSLEGRPMEGSTWVRLATFERQGRSLTLVSPGRTSGSPAYSLQADLGGQMRLLGYDLAPTPAHPGGALTVTLTWQAARAMSWDYTIFVHLLDSNGHKVAQHDGQPWNDVPLPTSSWRVGEVVRDVHLLNLPADLPPGTYQLQLGVYYWPTGERLPVLQDGEVVGDGVRMNTIAVK